MQIRVNIRRGDQKSALNKSVGGGVRSPMRYQSATEAVGHHDWRRWTRANGGVQTRQPSLAVGEIPIVLLNERTAWAGLLPTRLPMLRTRTAKPRHEKGGGLWGYIRSFVMIWSHVIRPRDFDAQILEPEKIAPHHFIFTPKAHIRVLSYELMCIQGRPSMLVVV